ncbi:glycosyltransferase family 4 protein [Solidesulfovibrio sp. C21]|uniref:glycosyltransferase family 4 protein n=1 Tax=Solidesulfovibrio sp. C21 TaxID=3398613 RepID=UPI0039FCECD1
MRVGLDLHGLSDLMQGSRTYIANLAARLPFAAPDIDFVYYVADPQGQAARALAPGASNVALRPIPPGRFGRLVRPFPARAAREVDVLHCQYVGPLLGGPPTVLTVHDILHESLPQYFPKGLGSLMRLLYPGSARRAGMVLTVSDFSRREIVSRYRVPGHRVAFALNGVGEGFFPVTDPARLAAVRRRLGLPEGPYLLYLGRIEPRKNLPGLVAAYRILRREMGGAAPLLVLAGGRDRLFAAFHEAMRRDGAGEGIVFAGSVAQDDLPALYSGAAAFVYPTFGEGFGLPVAEAMACGAPVVASSAPAVPEVAGEAALLVDPSDTEGLAAALGRVLTDPELAAMLRQKGLDRARELTWDAAVSLAVAAYRRVGGGKDAVTRRPGIRK